MSSDFTVNKPELVRCGKCLKDYSNKPGENHYEFVCEVCSPKMAANTAVDYEYFDDPATGSVDRAFIEEDSVVTTVYLDNSWFLNAGIDAPVDWGIFSQEERQKRTDANFPDTPDYIGVAIALDLATEKDRTHTMELKKDNASSRQVGGDHYSRLKIQPWDAIEAWGTREEYIGFLKWSTIPYIARANNKGGIEDLKKARHYLDKLIEVLENDEK